MCELEYKNLNKKEFLKANKKYIDRLLIEINTKLREKYTWRFSKLTLLDIWVITYAEAGIDGQGHIAPHYEHSNGEIGMYPLPKNIQSWNGPAAPHYNEPHQIDENVKHYFKYMGHLKSRVVKRQDDVSLYRDLFNFTGTEKEKDARILAGVIHGYFYSGNYSDGHVPLNHLIDGYDTEVSLPDLIRSTLYKHAGTDIIQNRAKNIDTAISDFLVF